MLRSIALNSNLSKLVNYLPPKVVSDRIEAGPGERVHSGAPAVRGAAERGPILIEIRLCIVFFLIIKMASVVDRRRLHTTRGSHNMASILQIIGHTALVNNVHLSIDLTSILW